MTKTSNRTPRVCAVALILGFALAANAEPEEHCSNSALHGAYAFSIAGNIQTPSGPLKISGVALTRFDGEGHLTNADHLLRNGAVPPVEWRPGSGTYLVHEDCTGEAHIDNEGSPTLDLYFVLADDGHEIRGVVSDPGANISANAVRVRNSDER